jgi:hypothetical protein
VWVPDGTKLSCKIHTKGQPDDVWKTFDGSIDACLWKKEFKLSDLDKKFEALETPLVAHVEIADYGVSACSFVLGVLSEGFVLSM